MTRTRTATWTNLGEDIKDCKSLDEALEKCGFYCEEPYGCNRCSAKEYCEMYQDELE